MSYIFTISILVLTLIIYTRQLKKRKLNQKNKRKEILKSKLKRIYITPNKPSDRKSNEIKSSSRNFITKEQLKIFKRAFKKANGGKISLPNKIIFDKITEIKFWTEGMRGGYSSRFVFRLDKSKEPYLEFISSSDYSSWHKLIKANGEIIDMKNYKGQFGRAIYSDIEKTTKENSKIDEYNQKLNKELVDKGLEQNFENLDFEKNNVDKRTNYFGHL